MNTSTPSIYSGQALLQLQIKWQALIRARAGYRQGTKARNEIDVIYFKALPVIAQIHECADEQELIRLTSVACSLLEEVLGGDKSLIKNAKMEM